MERWINLPVEIHLKDSDDRKTIKGLFMDMRDFNGSRLILLGNPRNMDIPQFVVPFDNVAYMGLDQKQFPLAPKKKIPKEVLGDFTSDNEPTKVLEDLREQARAQTETPPKTAEKIKVPVTEIKAKARIPVVENVSMERAIEFERKLAEQPRTTPLQTEYTNNQAEALRGSKPNPEIFEWEEKDYEQDIVDPLKEEGDFEDDEDDEDFE